MHLFDLLHPGCNALVAVAACQLGQTHAIGFDHAHTTFSHLLHKLAHAGIAPTGIDIDFNNGLRCGFETHAHGVEAEKYFGR